ncbi:phospho-acceptor domain-containing protein [Kribbella pratensis]|uniref:histidine kinase n=1 Tax=Kribbella pratensis TaxID=2512112 RepID=A0ABY2FR84_9ACTN|nr:phospho-acceptor domain-containing protein [Kribbella pratensis]TDX08461.1 phospho-acceptor domain-containing protein [Kribbella sp. VKM Ac-2566]
MSRALGVRPRQPGGLVTDVAVAVFIVLMVGLMIALPGHESGPYHVLFLGLAVAYGFRIWPVVPTVAVTVVITVISGWVIIARTSEGVLAPAELAEVPLLPLVVLVMVWHARRRAAAVEELERMAAGQLEAVDRELEFFREASHAIRTPVTIARGHLELVVGQALDSETRSDVYVALRQLGRMSALANRLLACARLDAGEALTKQPVDLGELVGEIAVNWSAAAERDWRIDSAPTGLIMMDPEWIAMAVDALVENAVHHTPDGAAITVRCGWTGSRRCTVAVIDSGPGVAAEDLPHVFDRFWHRLPPSGRMGTGLGLSMARSVTTAHGGDLSVRNGPDGGAIFELTLPAGRPLST